MKRVLDLILALIVLITICETILGLTNDYVVERANEVSEERINNNIIWRDSL
jgi:hypothetical protein